MVKKVFAWSPIRSLMKNIGAEIVAKDAVDVLISVLEETAKKITNAAMEFSRHARRKKLTLSDMELAIEGVDGPWGPD